MQLCCALGIAAEIFCEATNKRLQRIARPEGERPKHTDSFACDFLGLFPFYASRLRNGSDVIAKSLEFKIWIRPFCFA
jgi:hypothetical protein